MAKKKEDKKVVFRRIGGRIVPIAVGSEIAAQGARLAARGFHQARGVKRVFHGTTRKRGQAIRREGLRTSAKAMKTFDAFLDNRLLSFVSTRKASAKSFSKIAMLSEELGRPLHPQKDRRIKELAGLFGKKGDVIPFDIPLEKFKKKFIIDPETKLLKSMVKGRFAKLNVELVAGGRFATLGGISPHHIPAKSFKKRVVRYRKQILRTARFNRRHTIRGAGKIGAGLALIGAGIGFAAKAPSVGGKRGTK